MSFTRHQIFTRYQMKFSEDFKKSLEGFSPDEQINIVDTLLVVLECYRGEMTDTTRAGKVIEDLLKKYRKRLLTFSNLRLIDYFHREALKHIDLQYELKLDNAGSSDNFFTDEEMQNFLQSIENLFKLHKQMMYLHADPTAEAGEELKGTAKTKGKLKRDAEDNLTMLGQEQTALLIHYLQKGKIFLKDDYLSNKLAGEATSILTGYSSDTLRQTLSVAELERIKNKKNLTDLLNAFTRVSTMIESELREKKKSA